MKKKTVLNKKIAAYLLISAILTVLLSSCGAIGKSYEIAVIVKSTTSDFWQRVRDGVNAAATEYNVDITFEGPESEEDHASQNAMIVSAIARGVDAIVTSAVDYELSADAVNAAATAGIKVIMIDSGVASDNIESFIGTDNTEAGILAAKAALELSSDAVIGLISIESGSKNLIEREEAFKSFIAENGGSIADSVLVSSDTESARLGALELLEKHPDINILVGFNEWATLGIGYALRESGRFEDVAAVGFDNNLISIEMLETGEMDVLLVQNPFAIGYLGIESAVKLLSGEKIEKSISTTTTVVTKENMFDPENQRILFRFGN